MLDIHTHRPAPVPDAVINISPMEFNPMPGQSYSVGIHPWDTGIKPPEENIMAALQQAASHPQVVAIGECGIDTLKGGPMFRQIKIMEMHAMLAEKTGKPLIIHAVKSQDIIIGMKQDLKPLQPWIIHGFRGKPGMAETYLRAGCMLSFGEKFNPDALRIVADDMILCETDCSQLPILQIVSALSEAAGHDLLPILTANADRILGRV